MVDGHEEQWAADMEKAINSSSGGREAESVSRPSALGRDRLAFGNNPSLSVMTSALLAALSSGLLRSAQGCCLLWPHWDLQLPGCPLMARELRSPSYEVGWLSHSWFFLRASWKDPQSYTAQGPHMRMCIHVQAPTFR